MKCEDFTIEQRYAVIKILQLIMEADGVIHKNEIDNFNSALKEFDISENDIEIIASYDDVRCLRIISNMSAKPKAYAVNLFKYMASCDGFVDPREQAILDSI